MVVPVHPFQGGDLQFVGGLPGSLFADQFGLVQSDDRFRECVVIRIAGGADRAAGAGVDESFRVADSGLLGTAIRVVRQVVEAIVSGPDRHLERIQWEIGGHGRRGGACQVFCVRLGRRYRFVS